MNATINQSSCQAIPLTRQEISGGFAVVPHHLSRNKNVTDRELRLWLILHSYTKGKRACSPSVPRLASDMGCSVRTVQRLLNEMETKKLVSRSKRIGCETSYIPALAADVERPTPVIAVTGDTRVTPVTDVTTTGDKPDRTGDTRVTLREQEYNTKNSSLRSSSSKKNSEKREPSLPSGNSDSAHVESVPKKPASELRQFTDYFCQRWNDAFGVKYLFEKKDGVLAAKLIKVYDLATLKRCVDLFFDDKDEWLEDKRSFGTFKVRLPGYLSSKKRLQVVQPKPPQKISLWQSWEKTLCLKARSTPEREEWLRHLVSNHDRDLGSPIATINAFFHKCIQEDQDGEE